MRTIWVTVDKEQVFVFWGKVGTRIPDDRYSPLDQDPALRRRLAAQSRSSDEIPPEVMRHLIELERAGALSEADRIRMGILTDEQRAMDLWRESLSSNLPIWFKEIKSTVKTRFISVQRLIEPIVDRPRNTPSSGRPEATVRKYSEELIAIIRDKRAEAQGESAALDRTFPPRVIQRFIEGTGRLDAKEAYYRLTQQIEELEQKRQKLAKTGLLRRDDRDSDFQIPSQIRDVNKLGSLLTVLSVYVDDNFKKLDTYSELADKIDLFKQLIAKRFHNKTLRIDEEKGFVIVLENERPLRPEDLSSGEQHELVLLYELLFKVAPHSLVLIDEPELSLHIAWQQEFIRDLEAIIALANFDVLIATHSPDIINGRWDLAVALDDQQLVE